MKLGIEMVCTKHSLLWREDADDTVAAIARLRADAGRW